MEFGHKVGKFQGEEAVTINGNPVLHVAVLEAGKYLAYLFVVRDLFVLKIPETRILEGMHERGVHVTRSQCRRSGGCYDTGKKYI